MSAVKNAAPTLLMPKATAVWLVENTAQTFEQIGSFTGLHPIEVQALADEEIGRGIVGRNPVEHKEVTQEEIDKANADSSYIMNLSKNDLPPVKVRSKGPKYTPVSKRGDKVDAIAYLIKHHPEISDAQISRLIGTTKPTINSVRDRTHTNIASIKPRHPVDLGLCNYAELEASSKKGLKAQGKTEEEIIEHQKKSFGNQEAQTSVASPEEKSGNDEASGFDFSNFTSSTTSSEQKPAEEKKSKSQIEAEAEAQFKALSKE